MKTYNPQGGFEIPNQEILRILSTPDKNIFERSRERSLEDARLQAMGTQEQLQQENLRQKKLYAEAQDMLKEQGKDGDITLDEYITVMSNAGMADQVMQAQQLKASLAAKESMDKYRTDSLEIRKQNALRQEQKASQSRSDSFAKEAKRDSRAAQKQKIDLLKQLAKDTEDGFTPSAQAREAQAALSDMLAEEGLDIKSGGQTSGEIKVRNGVSYQRQSDGKWHKVR